MEPSNLNTPPPDSEDDVLLTTMIRGAAPELADDGFSQRVLAALPPRPSQPFPIRTSICLLGGLVGTALAMQGFVNSGGLAAIPVEFSRSLEQMRSALSDVSTPLIDQAFMIALAATAGSLLFAFRHNLRLR